MELNDWLAITGALRDWKLSAGIHIRVSGFSWLVSFLLSV